MRSPALFTMIVVGAAAAASAEPVKEETSGRVSYTEPEHGSADEPRRAGEWVELASPTPAKHSKVFIMVGADAGYFTKLRIDAAKGRTIVRTVRIVFTDGTVKSVRLDKVLSPRGRKHAMIGLGDAARAIERVVVETDWHTKGTYAVYGSSAGGDVASR